MKVIIKGNHPTKRLVDYTAYSEEEVKIVTEELENDDYDVEFEIDNNISLVKVDNASLNFKNVAWLEVKKHEDARPDEIVQVFSKDFNLNPQERDLAEIAKQRLELLSKEGEIDESNH